MMQESGLRIPFDIKKQRLRNGTRLVLVHRPGLLRKMALWAVPFGSLRRHLPSSGAATETEVLPAGVAHFLEHQLFREEDGGSVSDRFAALGVQENAFTYFDQTGYHFRGTNNFFQALQLLLSFTAEPCFTKESVANEREIITQELLMYRDLPEAVLELSLRQALFGEHPAGEDIGGTPESIALITPELLRRCHQCFYHPAHAVLVVIGDLCTDEIVEVAECVPNSSACVTPNALLLPKPIAAVGAPFRRELSRRMATPRPLLSLGFKEAESELDAERLTLRQLESNMLLDLICGKSSPGYWSLYSRGLINSTFHADYQCSAEFGYLRIGSECRDTAELSEAITALLFTQSEALFVPAAVERLKRKLLGEYIAGFEGFDSLAFELVAAENLGLEITALPRLLAQIDEHSLRRRYHELIRPEQMAVATVDC